MVTTAAITVRCIGGFLQKTTDGASFEVSFYVLPPQSVMACGFSMSGRGSSANTFRSGILIALRCRRQAWRRRK